ncbi:hypothetical protein Hypma_005118 [Hypsizygus marmoreus]|uniref:DUF6699 domain-containing protein n=1 Tax=Hypsizygus marmoreus TaxID=39966 RepID=A0A369K574_HYPMA|nr:hypothetical protein Hypma_005118 [Hypsizygus marmoreus]
MMNQLRSSRSQSYQNVSSTTMYTEASEGRYSVRWHQAGWENPAVPQGDQQRSLYLVPIPPENAEELEASMPPLWTRTEVSVPPSDTAPLVLTRCDEGPPPIDLHKSLYTCVGLPEVVDEPVVLNQALEFTTASYDERIIYAECPPIDASNHVCEPATYPSLQSMVVIYPTGRPLTVIPADKERNQVTVGDVLRAIDKEYFKTWTEWFGRDPNPEFDINGVPICLKPQSHKAQIHDVDKFPGGREARSVARPRRLPRLDKGGSEYEIGYGGYSSKRLVRAFVIKFE